MLRNYWYVACMSRSLHGSLQRVVLDRALTLSRAADGRVRAEVPVHEQDGYVWAWIGDGEPPVPPPVLAGPEQAPWAVARLEAVVENAVEHVIENFIDTCHTGYLHGGLFRPPASQVVRSLVKLLPDGVSIDLEEQNADGLLGRLLVRRGESVTHQDRFILPSTVRVAYRFGSRHGMTGTHLFTPETAWRTRIYVHVAVRMGPLTPLVRLFSPLFGRIILAQDATILNRQGMALRETPARFCSVGADTANGWIAACLKRAAGGESWQEREKVVEYRL